MPSAVALERSHRIHGTCIFPYIYHKTSTIHVGKYTIFPWILWGWIQQFRPSDRECLNQTLCPLFLLRYWVPVSLETKISGWPMKTFSEFGPLLHDWISASSSPSLVRSALLEAIGQKINISWPGRWQFQTTNSKQTNKHCQKHMIVEHFELTSYHLDDSQYNCLRIPTTISQFQRNHRILAPPADFEGFTLNSVFFGWAIYM